MDAEAFRDVADVVVSISHQRSCHLEITACDLGWPAAGLAACTGRLQSRHRALTDQIALELGQ